MSTDDKLALTPLSVTDHRLSGVLFIEWADGVTSALPHAFLRRHCRCAVCVQRARRGNAPPAAVPLTEIRPTADRGLNLVFADGHDRGIYPWPYLRALGDERRAMKEEDVGPTPLHAIPMHRARHADRPASPSSTVCRIRGDSPARHSGTSWRTRYRSGPPSSPGLRAIGRGMQTKSVTIALPSTRTVA